MHFWTAHEFVFLFCYRLSIECFSMVAGNSKFAQGLETYLLSRDHTNLKSEFQLGNGKVCLCSVSLFVWVPIQRSLFWLKHLIPLFFFPCRLQSIALKICLLLIWYWVNTFSCQLEIFFLGQRNLSDLIHIERSFFFSPCTTLFCPGKKWRHLLAVKIIIFVVVHTLHVLKETNASWSYALFQSLCCSVINIVYNVRLHYTCTTKKKTGPNAITIRNFFFIFHSSLK